MMAHIPALLIGAILAAAFAGFARLLGRKLEWLAYAIGLVGAAGLYVGFAVLRGGLPNLPLESVGLVIFSAAAWLGFQKKSVLLGLGWVVHALWDILLHIPVQPYVPSWYPAMCGGFDVALGIYILFRFRTLAVTPNPQS